MISDNSEIFIIKIEYKGDYKLRLIFNDNTSQYIDFFPFLSTSLNPLIRKYLDPNEFLKFELDNGDLQWNDYDLCFPIADLYENKIMPGQSTSDSCCFNSIQKEQKTTNIESF
jgi:hypothetical protein